MHQSYKSLSRKFATINDEVVQDDKVDIDIECNNGLCILNHNRPEYKDSLMKTLENDFPLAKLKCLNAKNKTKSRKQSNKKKDTKKKDTKKKDTKKKDTKKKDTKKKDTKKKDTK